MLDDRAQAPERAIRKASGLARGGRPLARKADSSEGATFPYARGADGLEGGAGGMTTAAFRPRPAGLTSVV
jgi:hypothetical protein